SLIITTSDSLDIESTRTMLSELYDALSRKTVVAVNKFFPETRAQSRETRHDLINKMEKVLKHPIIGIIPCYCDVLQAERTLLLAVGKPDHPFIKDLKEIVVEFEHNI